MPAQPTKDKAIGVIVYFEFPRSTKYLIVKHKKGHWSFAKGHKEKDESSIQTARRELYEEAGIKEVEFLAKKILARENIFLAIEIKVK
ncbi:MAG: NUDIX domain-containing protein [Ignavibacteria bacterium]|nr:NUDIX domain-containing protein [Ignavibacteria bacterium]